MSATAPSASATGSASAGRWPAVLCWLAVALEGFDLVVLGAVIPELLASEADRKSTRLNSSHPK